MAKVAGGSIPTNDFKQLSSGFPSIRHINQYSDQKVGAFVVNLSGLFLIETTLNYFTRFSLMLVVFQSSSAYILSPSTNEIEHANIYQGSVFSVAPNKTSVQFAQGLRSNQDWASSMNPTIQLR